MNCKIYKNTCCLFEGQTEENFNDYCCSDCLIHSAVEHDKLLEEEVRKYGVESNG